MSVPEYPGDIHRVQQKLPRPGPEPVDNLEVHAEHAYYVGTSGVLAHNACSSTSGNGIAGVTGKQMHKTYKAGLADNIRTFKEYVIPGTRKKIDYIDFANGIVYELKPNNARAIVKGMRQANRYVAELKKLFPNINWTVKIDTY